MRDSPVYNMFPGVIGKVNMGIIQRDGCNRVRDSKPSPASQATSYGNLTSALRLRMSRTFTGLHCTPPVALSGCGAWLHLGSLNSIHGSPIPRAPCQSEESEELRAKVYAWYIMSKRSMAH